MRLSVLLGSSLLLASLTLAVYAIGLHGTFLFDDFANLPALGAMGPVDDLGSFLRYITSGTADPTGRPLAMLSFLLDAHDWPAPAYPFKRTNLALHLATGLLLVQLLRRLGKEIYGTQDASHALRLDLAALLGSAFWLLHPLFVSTTLYIVQREAMLPALFTVIGMLLWLRGRERLLEGQSRAGCGYLVAGLGVCTLLAFLSKANGILLPALCLIVEWVLPDATPPAGRPCLRSSYRRAMILLAGLPTVFVAGYLVYKGWHGIVHGVSAARSWTMVQRLLTEPRVLVDYLGLLWLPRPFTPGLFNDHIHASVSLVSPLSTFPAILAVGGLLAGAVRLRKRVPAWALAFLFFFVGQSMESSTIALELYFEHRNYLPALLMFWPLALWLCGVAQARGVAGRERAPGETSPRTRAWLKAALAVLLLGGLGLMSHARAALWGNTHDQALLWAQLNPDSPRAQASAAQAEINAGRPDRAAKRLSDSLSRMPDQVQLALNLLAARCAMGHVDASTLQAATKALGRTRDTGALLDHWFQRAIQQSDQPTCPEMDLDTVASLLDAAMSNPALALPGRQQDLLHLQGLIALRRHLPDVALAKFNQALDEQVRTTAAFKQAALLGSHGYPRQALTHLDHYQAERGREHTPRLGMPRVHAWVLDRQHYWDKELARLRNTLQADAHAGTPPLP